MLQRRRQGLLGAILHADRPGGGVDWHLARTRLVQVLAGPPVVAFRVAWTILGGAHWALRAAADASGAWERLLALAEPGLVASRHVPLPASERRPLGGQDPASMLGGLEARLVRGAAARAGLALAASRAFAELPGAEQATGAVERLGRRPLRWAWRESGAAWVWAQGWSVGDALWELVSPPRDPLYRRPEAVALRTVATWLQRRVATHQAAAEHAAAMAVVVSGGPVPHSMAALASAGALGLQEAALAPSAANATPTAPGGEQPSGPVAASWLEQLQTLANRATRTLRPRQSSQWGGGAAQDGPALARASHEALRLVDATAAASALACASSPSGCPEGLSRQSLAAAALPVPPGRLGATLMDLSSVSVQLQAADALWAASDPSRAASQGSAVRVDWDGRLLRSSSSEVPGRAGLCVSGDHGECVPAPLGSKPSTAGVWWWWTGGLPEALAPLAMAEPLQVAGALQVKVVGPDGAESGASLEGGGGTRWRLARGVGRLAVAGATSTDVVIVAALRRWGEGGVAEFEPVGAGWVPSECLTAAAAAAAAAAAQPSEAVGSAVRSWSAEVALGCGQGAPAVTVRKASVREGECVLRMRGESPLVCAAA